MVSTNIYIVKRTYSIKISLIWIVILIIPVSTLYSQDLYETNTGKVLITTEIGQKSIALHSKSVNVFLDYDNALFILKLPINSIHTEIDSLNTFLKNSEESFLVIEGRMNIDNISTDPHPTLKFEITGDIKYAETIRDFLGTGNLEHIQGSDHIACLLELSFEIPTTTLFFPESYKTIIIKPIKFLLFQSLLEQHKHTDH